MSKVKGISYEELVELVKSNSLVDIRITEVAMCRRKDGREIKDKIEKACFIRNGETAFYVYDERSSQNLYILDSDIGYAISEEKICMDDDGDYCYETEDGQVLNYPRDIIPKVIQRALDAEIDARIDESYVAVATGIG